MARAADRTTDRARFLAADPTRLRIAEWCEAEALTREQIADRLGRPSGGMSAPDTMLRRKALLHAGFAESGRAGGRKAELLRLSQTWRKPLLDALQLRRPGALMPDMDLLLIPLATTASACAVLARGNEDIDWGVRLDGEQIGLILGPRSDANDGPTIRAVAALDREGAKPVRVRLKQPMSAEELRRWALSVAGEDRARLSAGEA